MTRYLISFDAGAMDHIPDEHWPAVARASHAGGPGGPGAGVWVFGGGLESQRRASWPTTGWLPTARTRRPREVIAGSRRGGALREEALE